MVAAEASDGSAADRPQTRDILIPIDVLKRHIEGLLGAG